MVTNNQLTEDEAQLYDRQIRLWGVESQKRLREARILIIGVGGLGAEVTKNIILSGVKSVNLLDSKNVTEAEAFSQFLIPEGNIGENRAIASRQRAQSLNPLVEVVAHRLNVSDLSEDFFSAQKWDVVIASCLTTTQYIKIDDVCRKNGIKFFMGDVFGLFGFMFSDLTEHTFLNEVPSLELKKPTVKKVKETLKFSSFRDAIEAEIEIPTNTRRFRSSFFTMNILMDFRTENNRDPLPTDEDLAILLKMRDKKCAELKIPTDALPDQLFKWSVGAPLGPACSNIGGIISQEIIKVVTRKEQPLNNMYFFDPIQNRGHVQTIPTPH